MSRTVSVERAFEASPEAVYGAYWGLENWPRALSNIVDAGADYDDGVHQCFTMVVDKDGARETVRGVRIGVPFAKVELCQFVPPPGFRVMRGEWRFAPSGTGTQVVAERVYETSDPAGGDAAGALLKSLLEKNLVAFDRLLSGGAA